MIIKMILNGRQIEANIADDLVLLEFLREKGCYSVKRGCETANCGLCTVLVDGKTVLSCSYPAARADGKTVTTLEGLHSEAAEFGGFMADEGADQCGFCNPGFIMNVLSMADELENPTDNEILEYLSGNMCRCTGYESQLRAIRKFLAFKKGGADNENC